MAQRIQTLCDLCLENGKAVEGEETPHITIGNAKPRVLAFCEEHRKDFYDPFFELVKNLGAMAEAPARVLPAEGKKDAGYYPCPDPACPRSTEKKPMPSASALRTHVSVHHQGTVTELVKKHGKPDGIPVDVTIYNVDEEYPCEECGRVFSRLQSRAVHVSQIHKGSVTGGRPKKK